MLANQSTRVCYRHIRQILSACFFGWSFVEQIWSATSPKGPAIQLLHNSPLSWHCHGIIIFTTQRLKGYEMPLKSFRMAKLLVYSTHAHALASEVFLESRIALSSESKGVCNRVENLLHTQLGEGMICRDVVLRGRLQEFLWWQGKNWFSIWRKWKVNRTVGPNAVARFWPLFLLDPEKAATRLWSSEDSEKTNNNTRIIKKCRCNKTRQCCT